MQSSVEGCLIWGFQNCHGSEARWCPFSLLVLVGHWLRIENFRERGLWNWLCIREALWFGFCRRHCSAEEEQRDLQKCTHKLVEILAAAGLRLNAAKCEIFSLECEDMAVKIGEDEVKEVESFSIWGAWFPRMEVHLRKSGGELERRVVLSPTFSRFGNAKTWV